MSETRYIELLAPAKNLEVGRVAIDAGADAVYIGGPAFGARKAAGNSLENIAELCRYAHIFGVRVFTTLNTLLRDDEMDEAVRLACSFREAGVDAILIQDLRLARILLDMGGFEHMLHASTQCDVRNLEKVQELEAMGFDQVVLARELSYAEMKHIREHTTVALEAFVHGALCVSYSGACYLSEAVCGRSANRGECAQMCRLTYDVLDENKQELLHQKHVLSLRDLDRSLHLRELLDAGITTLKIEGRLKDADYVRNVVAYYRQRLDELFSASDSRYARSSRGITRIQFTPDPAKTFQRGATEYFSFFAAGDTPDKRPDSLVNMDTPKSTGEFLGYTPIREEWGLHNGDGLAFGTATAQTDASAIATASLKRHRPPLSPGETAKSLVSVGTPNEGFQGFYWPSKQRLPAGLPVYRTYNAEFQRQLAAKDATRRTLPLKIVFSETPEGFSIEMGPISPIGPNTPVGESFTNLQAYKFTNSHILSFPADKVPATNAERAEAVVCQQLSKLGDTPFEAAEVEIRWSQAYFLPAATLNAWRRDAVEAQTNALAAKPIRPIDRIGQMDQLGPMSPIIPTRSDCQESISSNSPVGALSHESREIPSALMTCRYCLLHEIGCCKRLNPKKSGIPTYLRRGDMLLRIKTDCNACLMTLERVSH